MLLNHGSPDDLSWLLWFCIVKTRCNPLRAILFTAGKQAALHSVRMLTL